MDGTTYRPSRPLILASTVLAVLIGCLAGVSLVFFVVGLFRGDFGDAAWSALNVVLVGAFAALMWRQSRLRVVVRDDGLHVVNYFSTFRLRWDSIQRFDSSSAYWGILVVLKDGHVKWLNAVQKWNIAVWLNRPTRADKIADELTGRLAP